MNKYSLHTPQYIRLFHIIWEPNIILELLSSDATALWMSTTLKPSAPFRREGPLENRLSFLTFPTGRQTRGSSPLKIDEAILFGRQDNSRLSRNTWPSKSECNVQEYHHTSLFIAWKGRVLSRKRRDEIPVLWIRYGQHW